LAIALLVATAPAQALELGTLTLQSRLGEPLAATVGVRLGPGEMLAAGCLASADPQAGLPNPAGLRVSLATTTGPATVQVRLSSGSPLTEPAYGLRLRTSCAGLPVVVRDYVLVPDLPGSAPAGTAAGNPTAAVNAAAATTGPAAAAATPTALAGPAGAATAAGNGARTARSSAPRRSTPIAPGERYTVQPGDTLWAIASRVEGLGGSTGTTAAAIHGANPDAFIAADPGRLLAGASLVIPTSAAVPRAAVTAVTATDAASDTPAGLAAPVAPVAGRTATQPTPAVAAAAQPARIADAPAPAMAPASPPASVTAATPATSRTDELAGRRTQPAVAPAGSRPLAAAPVAEAPLVSGLAGVAFGLLVSLTLWRFGPRRTRATPRSAARAGAAIEPPPVATALGNRAGSASATPAISVSFEPLPADDEVAASTFRGTGLSQSARVLTDDTTSASRIRPADEITAELEALFNTPPDGRAADEATVQAPSGPARGVIDLPALAVGSATDELKAQGLRDALALLERDYEEERTDTRRTLTAPDATPNPLRGRR
jgi:Tfp pilus assembly protein FimV